MGPSFLALARPLRDRHRRRTQCIVGLTLDHGPYHDAKGGKAFLEQREL